MRELKLLTPEALAEVYEIELACHRFPMSLRNVESCFGRFYHVLGVFEDEQLQGFAIAHILFEDATLMDICVLPASQGKGYGKALMAAVVDLAAVNSAERLMLEVRASSAGAIGLYRAYGFEQTGTRHAYYQHEQGKEDAVLMERLL
ncbi:ribosomal-protein-alanine acetyltransferase [Shewanella colwelliana]|uniref:ribosomal protein S18-alanine N-acetyltransferase n=1 Tax=Shewanella colwelliana TaxID=23 RepID=UPI001BC44D35|nr:ribosomal protein S18-alanine N-acetyltransferase [Shewanella colwelliana]GIU32769.1 ribosomal-protein-alanine acetyltransferase [Shewanella colwelliana]